MYNFRWNVARIIAKLFNNEEYKVKYLRRMGMRIGENCYIYSNIMTPEAYLIEIGDNTTISSDVIFVTHDNSIIKVDRNCPNLFGFIKVGKNCFIGQRATLMYGVTLSDNVIVASGSVVANSFSEERIIIGGNPAKIIGTWDEFISRNKSFAMSRYDVYDNYLLGTNKFVTKKSK